MNLLLLSIFGIFLSFFLYFYTRVPYKHTNKIEKQYDSTRNKIFLLVDFLLLFYFAYVVFGTFQYIETNKYIAIVKANDLPRYKMYYGIVASSNSYGEAFENIGLEPFFTFLYYFCGKISSNFSFFLFLFYSFNFYSWLIFIKRFKKNFNIITAFAFFSFIFTQYLISFCLLRMEVAVTIALWVYIFLDKKKLYKAFFTIIFAVLVHNSAIFLLIPFFLYLIYLKKDIRRMFFCFLAIFSIGLIGSSILPFLLPLIARRYLAYMTSSGVAFNTYLTNSFFLFLIYLKRKVFFKDFHDVLLVVFLLSSLLILDFQLAISMFYRMIYFTQPALFIIIGKVFSIYKLEAKHMERNFIIRIFLILYIFFYYYKFSTGVWEALDLVDYKLDFNFLNL